MQSDVVWNSHGKTAVPIFSTSVRRPTRRALSIEYGSISVQVLPNEPTYASSHLSGTAPTMSLRLLRQPPFLKRRCWKRHSWKSTKASMENCRPKTNGDELYLPIISCQVKYRL